MTIDRESAAEATGTPPTDDASASRPLLAPQDALQRLKQGLVVQNVRIERLVLVGKFTEAVTFRNVSLVRPQFRECVFEKEVLFENCVIDRPIVKGETQFLQNWSLARSTINRAQWHDIIVHGTFSARESVWKGMANFARARFTGRVDFWDAVFEGWADFKSCQFHGEFDFRSAHLQQGISFKECLFAHDFLFRGTTVAKKLEAAQSRFEGLVDFSKAKLQDYVYLEAIEQGPRQLFAFQNTLGERVLLAPRQIQNRLRSEQNRDFATAMHEYAFLKRAYSTLHRYEEEDWAFYRFKLNQRRARVRSWWRPTTRLAQFFDWLLLDVGCGYGTNPMRAVCTSMIIILLFATVYAVGVTEFHIEKAPFASGQATDPLNRAMFGLVTSVAVFTSGLSGIREIAKGWMNVPLIMEALLGTLLWGLFIVAFSRKVIR